MHELKLPRVKHQSSAIASIAGISDNGVAILGEMDAYLVLASALQPHLDKRSILLLRHHPVQRAGKLSVFRIFDRPNKKRLLVFGKIALEKPFLLIENSMHPRKICLFSEFIPVRPEIFLHFRSFGDHHHAGRLAVETMHEIHLLPAAQLPFADIVVKGIFHGMFATAPGCARKNPRRLFDNYDIQILMEDIDALYMTWLALHAALSVPPRIT